MTRRLQGAMGVALTVGAVLGLAARAGAAALDSSGDMSLGVRAYTAARIGSQNTNYSIIIPDRDILVGAPGLPQQTYRSVTFPLSAQGHMRQNRFFVEAELRHDLDRLIQEGFGPLNLLDYLPFKLRNVKYNLTYRGEYEGVYDYGPSEYRTAKQYYNFGPCDRPPDGTGAHPGACLVLPFSGKYIDVISERQTLRNTASLRNRLFQAFIEADAGPLYFRFGRQILAWGETDVFRLLDNINPLDNSFGGFLIPLDERRVPLDMLRASYHVPGSIAKFLHLPFYETFLEGYAAIDDACGIDPGIPNGSPWQLPNLQPSATTLNLKNLPPRNFSHTRGGVQLKFSTALPFVEQGTFGIAHYYTYLDTPVVQTFVSQTFPLGFAVGPNPPYLAVSLQKVPTVQITGASGTFAVPSDYVRYIGLSGEPIIRTELAYFHNEPRFSQSQLDPFTYFTTPNACHPVKQGITSSTPLCTGGGRTGDSWNFVLGMDLNQYIRAINPNQTFFITTQFFYKHLNGAVKRKPLTPLGNYAAGQPTTFEGEVLPVPGYYISPDSRGFPRQQASEPVFVHNPVDQYLQTLLIATQYYSGQVIPALAFLYDWSGAVVMQPQITLSRDPFRFTMSYSYLAADRFKGGSGISLLHDRDNVLFQFEYVL
jgi:hypothetical protein